MPRTSETAIAVHHTRDRFQSSRFKRESISFPRFVSRGAFAFLGVSASRDADWSGGESTGGRHDIPCNIVNWGSDNIIGAGVIYGAQETGNDRLGSQSLAETVGVSHFRFVVVSTGAYRADESFFLFCQLLQISRDSCSR